MTEKDYQKLNDYLQEEFEYLEQTDDFFLNNMEVIRYLNKRYYDLVSSYDYIPESPEIYVDEDTICEYSRKIIESISPSYLNMFDTLKENNGLTFTEDDIFVSHTEITKNEKGIHKKININLSHSYYDVKKVVHEFIHYTNNQGNNPAVHNLGEFLSVYFELYAEKCMMNDGISSNELQSFDRIGSTYEYCKNLLDNIDILYIYQQMGKIDIKQIDDINNIIDISKEKLENKSKNLLEYFRQINDNIFDIKQLYGNRYSLTCQYLFGTLLGVYAIKNCKIEDIVYLNDHINEVKYTDTGIEIITLLQQIGIDLTDDEIIDEMFNCIEEYINKINNKVIK